MRRRDFFAAAIIASCNMLACRAPQQDAPPHAAEDAPLEVLVSSSPEVLDPRLAADAISFRTTRLLHAGLFRLGEDLSPEPYVAREHRWLDDRTLRVTLRNDVFFSGGQALRARDVVATLQAFAAEGSRQRRVVEAIASARAVGEHTVDITLARAHGTLLSDLELPILREQDARAAPLAASWPPRSPEGLGPYRLADAQPEPSALRLEPRAGGAAATPKHALLLRTVRDENARAMRLLAGRADVLHNGLSPALWKSVQDSPNWQFASRPGANLTYLVVRHGRGALDRPEVRRALSLALDRQRMVQSFFHGRAEVAKSAMPPVHWAHPHGAEELPYDASAARALLRASVGDAQVPLVLSCGTDRLRGTIARFIAQQLREVGFVVRIEPLELGVLLARLGRGEFELALLQMPELTEPNALKTFLHSESVPPRGANRGRYRDAVLDQALNAGEAQTQRAARLPHYLAAERRLREMLPIIPLWHEHQVVITSQRARGFLPSAEGRWLQLSAY